MKRIEQFQVADYLLKRIALFRKTDELFQNLRFVVSINESLWYGDFVKMKAIHVNEDYIDERGRLDTKSSSDIGESNFLLDAWKKYLSAYDKSGHFPGIQLDHINDSRMLFDSIKNFVLSIDMQKNCSPFRACLYDAHSLDKKISLPFIDLSDVDIRLVSIIKFSQ